MGVIMLDTMNNNPALDFSERCQAFLSWVDDNRQVTDDFAKLAKRLKSRNRHSYGGQAIWEHMRFNSAISDRDGEYKLNNNTIALITRFVMLKHPELCDFFKVREINGLSADKATRILSMHMRLRGELS